MGLIRTELVGRDREMAALRDSLEDALRGHPRLVLCRGEPGIGKTRLAEELVVWAARSLNPRLQAFRPWLAANKDRIRLRAAVEELR